MGLACGSHNPPMTQALKKETGNYQGIVGSDRENYSNSQIYPLTQATTLIIILLVLQEEHLKAEEGKHLTLWWCVFIIIVCVIGGTARQTYPIVDDPTGDRWKPEQLCQLGDIIIV